jgi:putative nucleotidyltransferase with HDIG domain
MKQAPIFFQSLTEQLTHWRQQWKGISHSYMLNASEPKRKQTKQVPSSMVGCKTRRSIETGGLGWVAQKRSPFVFVIAVVSLTGVMGHKLYNQPQLNVGMPAPQTIRAPYPSKIEDKTKTEEQRKAATRGSVPVLMVDARVNETIEKNLQQLLNEGNEIRTSLGSFPFVDTSILSLPTQRYLRLCSDSEWEALLLALENNTSKSKVHRQNSRNTIQKNLESLLQGKNGQRFQDLQLGDLFKNIGFTQALTELEAYHSTTQQQNLSSLIAQISKAREAYTQAITKLIELEAQKQYKLYSQTSLLDLSDEDWANTQIGIQQTAEKILTQGIPLGLPKYILQNAVNLHVQALIPKNAEALATKLLLAVLEPNLKKDEFQTQITAAQAAAEVKPVMVLIPKGQVIAHKGEILSAWNIEVLEHYRLIRREVNWSGLIVLGSCVSGAIGIFVLVQRRLKWRLRQCDDYLVLLLTLSTPLMLTIGISPYTTWSAVGLLLGSYYGASLGAVAVVLTTMVLPVGLEISKVALLAGAAGGVLGSCMAQRLRSREELALLSVGIALTQGTVYLLLKLVIGAAFGSVVFIDIIHQAGLFAVSGLSWSIMAMGLSPYLEKLFDLVTPIRLSELASPNRPLLKRLATETPGTFQHTLLVANLAEAAAKHLGCNVELVRAGALYHDIGKMHDPLGFIENQMGGPNKHDTEINNPWKSAEIIKKHVTEGLVMARRHSLPTAIQAFIPEHQGTMQIAYFYHQAQQMAQEDPTIEVREADFRYEGPIPQSRETGIVMLADSCEAALRSLKDATPEQALAMINNILRGRWQDNQLVDCGLTREDMSQIAEIFVKVWQQFHHKRIAYPKSKICKD